MELEYRIEYEGARSAGEDVVRDKRSELEREWLKQWKRDNRETRRRTWKAKALKFKNQKRWFLEKSLALAFRSDELVALSTSLSHELTEVRSVLGDAQMSLITVQREATRHAEDAAYYLKQRNTIEAERDTLLARVKELEDKLVGAAVASAATEFAGTLADEDSL